MDDKSLNKNPAPAGHLDNQWVMVFNLITGTGKEEQKKTFKVNKKRIVIGSALSSDIRIQQNAVSNVHAVVEMDDQGQAMIYDMASETGIFLNDKKILTEELKDGDEINIGFSTLTYKRQGLSEAQAQLPPGAVRPSASGTRKLFYDAKEDFRPLILEDERNVIQIFDYPSSAEQALQVVMYWGDVILDVRHIVDDREVTLGEGKKSTFLVPGLHSNHTLVTFEGAAQLQFTGEMTGVVRTGRQVIPLNELGASRFHLKQNDQAKIQFRDITFFVSYSPVPPHLRRQRVLERDPLYTRIWFTSIATTLALILLLWGIEPPEKLETEELPPRVATIIFKQEIPPPQKAPPPKPEPKPEPPKQEIKPVAQKPPPPPKKPPPPPKELPREVKPVAKPVQKTKPAPKPVKQAANQVKGEAQRPRGGNEGDGARAKGPEGTKGKPNAPKAPVAMNASRGNPRVNTPVKSVAQGEGNVEALFSDIGGNISKKMAAAGAGASAAGKNLRGYGAFDTQGNGGLGNMGSGRGGGGESTTVQGLGTKRLGDGAKGTGLGAIGSGGDLAGTGRGRPNVQVGNASETIIVGGLDRSIIDEYIKRHMRQIRNCYERELNASPGLKGRIGTRFVISGSGRVTQSGVESSSMGNVMVEKCLTDVIRRIVFPEPLGGGIVEVSYPFSFTSAAGN